MKNHIAPFGFFTDRPIASIAFHAEGEVLAVASGHKVSIIDFSYTALSCYFLSLSFCFLN